MDDSRSSLHVDMSWRRDKLSAFVDYNRVSDDDSDVLIGTSASMA